MTRSLGSLLTRTMCLTIGLVGCAASPIVETDGGEQLEADGGLMGSETPATQDDGDTEPGVDPNADLDGGSLPAPGVVTARRDAGRGAGSTLSDSGVRDAGRRDAGAAAADATLADAGRRPARVDGGASTSTPAPTPTPARDAGQAAPNPGSCRSDADCTELCVPIGILSCCRENGTCGCTWAPGAYCS